ncbi:unnamed protein product, partial [Amoebophrya sp. A120]
KAIVGLWVLLVLLSQAFLGLLVLVWQPNYIDDYLWLTNGFFHLQLCTKAHLQATFAAPSGTDTNGNGVGERDHDMHLGYHFLQFLETTFTPLFDNSVSFISSPQYCNPEIG